MARYNHTLAKIAAGLINPANLKCMLLDSNASFDGTHTTIAQVSNTGAWEVSGSGWDSGGEVIANAAFSTVNTNHLRLDGDDIEVVATGGAIGPCNAAVIYDSGNGNVGWYYQFPSSRTASDGSPFKVLFNASGIFDTQDPA